jgi:hypothetical protein
MNKKIYYSDLANVPASVCLSSLDENLEPIDSENTAHVLDTDDEHCAECGTDICSICLSSQDDDGRCACTNRDSE